MRKPDAHELELISLVQDREEKNQSHCLLPTLERGYRHARDAKQWFGSLFRGEQFNTFPASGDRDVHCVTRAQTKLTSFPHSIFQQLP
jgi:hypothetical protein